MSLDFHEYELGDLCNISSSKRIFAREYVDDGIPFYRGKEIIELFNNRDVSNELFITREKYESIKEKYGVPEEGDILLSSVGTLGVPYLVKNEKFYFKDGNLTWFKDFHSKLNNKFLYWWFQSVEAKYQINNKCIGSTQKALPIKTLEKFEINIPSIKTQIQIVDILESISNKIKTNISINKNLEQLIHTIFNNWFISFEKFNNLKFTQTVLGDIPEGWNCGVLRDLLTLTKNPIKATETNGLPYLPIDIIPMNSLGISELKSDEEANSSLITFDKNDILIGAMRVYFHRVVISPCSGVTRSTCFVLKPKKEDYLSYLLLLCNLDQTIQYAQNTSKGTTMPYAVWDNGLGDMDIIIPPENVLNEFHQLVFPIIEKIRDSYNEINKLQKLRDTLLPKLMSGEIDVSKINCDLE